MEQRKNIFQIPTTDFSFKKIFGTEQNKRFLIRFLNCFVSKYTGEIVDVTYLPTEYCGMVDTEKKAEKKHSYIPPKNFLRKVYRLMMWLKLLA